MGVRARPIRLEPAFEDPASVLACARAGGPYRLLSVVDRSYEGNDYPPWFRGYWVVPGKTFLPDAAALLHDRGLIEAASRCFGAQVIRPQTLMINLAGPMHASPPHTDLPYFRGAPARTHPVELLFAMGRSGLFERWAICIASVVVWFQLGEGGGFEYWPEGRDAASRVIAPPLWNVGLVSDNDHMLHRAQATGPAEAELPRGHLRREAELHASTDGGWEIRHGEELVVRYPTERVRVSILWKAQALADAADAAIVDEASDDLDLEIIVQRFADDARHRGMTLPDTQDPLSDRDWIGAVAALHLETVP